MSFREIGKEIKAYDVAYFTASCDKEETNRKFAESLQLDYPILSDPTRKAAIAFGLVKENAVGLGRFPKRWTFYIGKDGKILAIDKNVKFRSHGADVVQKLAELKMDRVR